MTNFDNPSPLKNEESKSVSITELRAIDVNSVLAEFRDVDRHSISKPLREASTKAEECGDHRGSAALRLLHDLNNIHLRAEDRAEPFGPIFQSAEGRTCIASDFCREQNDVLAEFAKEIDHPVLKARLADIAWYNNRTKAEAGRLAIESYCEIIENRQSGQIHRTYGDDDRLHDSADYLQRALQIAARLHKSGMFPDRLKSVFEVVYERSATSQQYVVFCNLTEAGLGYRLLDWDKIVQLAERVVNDTSDQNYPQAKKGVWELAARGYENLNDDVNKKRCQREVILQNLKMCDQVSSSAAQAHWVRIAVGELRRFGGFKEWFAELRGRLRDLEQASLDEFDTYQYTLDVKDVALGTIAVFEKLTLPDILLQLSLLSQPVSKIMLKAHADESAKKYIVSQLFGGSYTDRDGKVIAQTSAHQPELEQSEEWYKTQSLQYLEIHRKHAVAGLLQPAAQNVMARFPLEQRHFLPIVESSPFVQPGYQHVFSLGFARLWQGDYASAACLLIPQLENSIRYVLKNTDEYQANMMPDLTQDDLSLTPLLSRMRPAIEQIFGEDLTNEIDLLFNFRPGPALRHEMAHGKMSDGHCYSSDAIYGCWLIYHLTCLPLIAHWKDIIGPGIEAQAF